MRRSSAAHRRVREGAGALGDHLHISRQRAYGSAHVDRPSRGSDLALPTGLRIRDEFKADPIAYLALATSTPEGHGGDHAASEERDPDADAQVSASNASGQP